MMKHNIDFQANPEYFQPDGQLKPSAILYIAQEAAGAHAALLGTDWDTLQQKNLFWAVIRTKVDVFGTVSPGSTIRVCTWPMPTSRTAYPRMVQAMDQEGNLIFNVLSLWVLMDTNTRAMVLPGKSGVEVVGALYGNEPELPRGLPIREQAQKDWRTVEQQHLDRNGHMNNTRYMDWVMELCPEKSPVKGFELCYFNEGRFGDKMELGYTPSEGEFSLDIHRLQTDVSGKPERIFSARVQF